MQKSYTLQPYELDQQRALDDERRNLLAQFGALTLDLEGMRERLKSLDLRGRALVNAVAARHGITEYRQLTIQGGQLIGDIIEQPENPLGAIPAAAAEASVPFVNGRG